MIWTAPSRTYTWPCTRTTPLTHRLRPYPKQVRPERVRVDYRIGRVRLVSQADLYPGVPSRSLLRARCCSCRSCAPGGQSVQNVTDGPTREWPGTVA